MVAQLYGSPLLLCQRLVDGHRHTTADKHKVRQEETVMFGSSSVCRALSAAKTKQLQRTQAKYGAPVSTRGIGKTDGKTDSFYIIDFHVSFQLS